MQQFDLQRTRGLEGFGLFDGQENHMVHAAKEERILNWLCRYDSNLIMFHHRFPTSTVNVRRAAHPFSTKKHFGKTQYILIHNGHISNSDELFEEHQEQGIEYQSLLQDLTFNDSEALLWDFARVMEGKQKELKARGNIAFICLKLVEGELQKMYFGRNNNPLVLYRDKQGIRLSSEGEGDLIEASKLYTWNYKLKRLTKRNFNMLERWAYVPDPNYNYDKKWNYNSNWNSKTGTWESWEDRDTTNQAGNWLGKHLRDKFSGMGFFEDDDDDVIEYEQDPNTQMYLPVGVTPPSKKQIKSKAMSYLIACSGRLDDAYWAVELDYGDIAEDLEVLSGANRVECLKEVRLLEGVMDYISDDPEYIDKDSVSSMWEALWQQQSLKTV